MVNISVLILNKNLAEPGILANASFVLGLSAGRHLPESTFGPEVVDGDGKAHHYLTNIGHYVRVANPTKLATLRGRFAEMPGVIVVDYPEDAAPADYDEYTRTLASHCGEEITYRAVHVFGPEELVAPLTKSLSRA